MKSGLFFQTLFYQVNRAMFLYVTKAENRPYEDLEDEDVVKSSLPQKVRDLAIPEVK